MVTEKSRAVIWGAGGYVGGELLRLVLQHPDITEVVATSRSQAGRPIAEVHPALATLTEARFAGLTAGEAARGHCGPEIMRPDGKQQVTDDRGGNAE